MKKFPDYVVRQRKKFFLNEVSHDGKTAIYSCPDTGDTIEVSLEEV